MWCIYFKINGKGKFLGYFKDFNEAVKRAREVREEIQGEFSNHQ